jgi:hypothetical protein
MVPMVLSTTAAIRESRSELESFDDIFSPVQPYRPAKTP